MSAEQIAGDSLFQFLSSIRSSNPISAREESRIRRLVVSHRTRDPVTHAVDQEQVVFQSVVDGLRASGWSEVPGGGISTGRGKSGVRKLAFRSSDRHLAVEGRQMAIVEYKNAITGHEVHDKRTFWKEVSLLRSCVHENIIDYFSHFVVEGREAGMTQDVMQDRMQMFLLLEYANAGNLRREIRRHPRLAIPEPGARYYALQISAGVKYLHQRLIRHANLNPGNILLRYNDDAVSKTCLISDFAAAHVFKRETDLQVDGDVKAVAELALLMIRGFDGEVQHKVTLSPDAHHLMSCFHISSSPSAGHKSPSDSGTKGQSPPKTIDEMLDSCLWFKGAVVAPNPKPPAPVLLAGRHRHSSPKH